MSSKTICDACGQDMTNDPAAGRLAFRFDRGPLEVHQRGEAQTWPHGAALRIEIGATRLDDGLDDAWPAKDICSACVIKAVVEGYAEDLGPVTR